MLRICWIQHGGEFTWLPHLVPELRALGIDMEFVNTLAEADQAYKAQGFKSCLISPEAFDEKITISNQEIEEFDAKYGAPLIQNIVNGDVHLELIFGGDEGAKRRVVCRAYKFWERYLAENPIDVFMVRETASFATRTAYNVSRVNKKPILIRFDSGASNDYLTFTDIDEEQNWRELLAELAKGVCPLTQTEKEKVAELLATRVVRPGKVEFRKGGVSLLSLPKILLRDRWHQRKIDFKSDPIAIGQRKLTRRFIWQRSIWQFGRKFFPYSRPKLKEDKYVYLPLYFVDEGHNRARYHFWSRNLLSLIREISASLPQGYQLYVKEHPAVPGDQSFFNLLKIRNIDRVKVIGPEVAGFDLTENAAAVVVVQGTAGWETFLMRKPLVVISSGVFYAHSRLVYAVKDICQLPKALYEAIKNGGEIYRKHEEEFLWFIHCVLKTSTNAHIIRYNFPYYVSADQPTYKIIADSISKKIASDLRQNATAPASQKIAERSSC